MKRILLKIIICSKYIMKTIEELNKEIDSLKNELLSLNKYCESQTAFMNSIMIQNALYDHPTMLGENYFHRPPVMKIYIPKK